MGRAMAVMAVGAALSAGVALGSRIGPAGAGTPPATRDAAGRDLVAAWNRTLLGIVRTPGAQPAAVHPTRNFAIMHTAIADAVADAGKGSAYAAAAQAGHDTLAALYPARAAELDRQLAGELADVPDGPSEDAGVRAGRAAAGAVLADRAHDGSEVTPPPFVPSGGPGGYRPTPPAFAAPVFTHWAAVRPFALGRGDRFRPPPYPRLGGKEYAGALGEVQALGRDTSTERTADQTTQARFWAAPIWNHWNEIAQDAARRHGTGLAATARMFAVLDRTLADSVIALYDGKYHHAIWRPVTAIRAAGTDGNPATRADPDWQPLAVTPPDPSYPGAHSVVGEAGATVLAAFFGPADRFTVGSEALPGVTRSFERYQDAADEAGLSRIYAGVHTRLDHTAGQVLGRRIARYELGRALRPSRTGG
ncbi:vanadium-dependent haloperoxidase [Actinomadura graeca]|uniref:Vanadium-dependent haloperoxidase n=1 Tax=Actinomadura graeca TaxID=2750812 RepID=A0ABX8R551_9ACTN|nr:vanadium-dependent haloperoxidase [Actinomadura graeca]QXJ26211.1 vanadium-dependent haloperoxidase [Actinomadura graeca]